MRDDLFAAFEGRRFDVGREVLRHALRHQHQRANDRDREQNVQTHRVRSTQKLPIVCAERRAKPQISTMDSTIPAAAEK